MILSAWHSAAQALSSPGKQLCPSSPIGCVSQHGGCAGEAEAITDGYAGRR